MLPPHHGVHENGLDPLPADRETLATRFKAAGYRTGAFVGAFVLDRRFGLARGFDEYNDRVARDARAVDRLEAERPANEVVDAALAWLAGGSAGAQPPAPGARVPFFAWIHVYDPHSPYRPPPEYAARAGTAYDGEVMFADAQLARVWHWLDAAQLSSSTVVVVAGDHGEGLGDHGERTHGMLLYDTTLRVPLLVAAPGYSPLHRQDPVTLADVAPTLLRLAHVETPAALDGRDLFDEHAVRTLYSETDYPRVAGWSPLRALTDGRWMAVKSYTSLELYDIRTDPAEQQDVAGAQSATARAIAGRLDALGAAAVPTRDRVVSADTAERLRSLGYVAGSPQAPANGHAPNPAARITDWNSFEDVLAAVNAGNRAAREPLRRLARTHPDGMIFTTTLARAEKETGDLGAALALYRDAARRWPTDPMILHDLAACANDAAAQAPGPEAPKLIDESARAERAALALQPDYAAAHNGLGLLAANSGDAGRAVGEFSRATEFDPTNASYWTNLGNARRSAGDPSAARAAYDRALELDPRESDAANGLGVLLVASGRAAEAIPWFERALAADSSSVDARLNLGIAFQQSGNPHRAAVEYRAVLRASPVFARQRDAARKLLLSLGAAP